MRLLIDGHNLIGSNVFSDIRLRDEDDEAKLVMRLKVWQSRLYKDRGGSMTVIFDRGIPGGLDVKMGGSGVEVVFAANPAQADDLIRRRLQKANKSLVLVTNDEALLRDAATYGVTTWRGAEFIERMMLKIPDLPEAGTEVNVQVSKTEVDEWLALFRAQHEAKKALKPRPSPNGLKPQAKSAEITAKSVQPPTVKPLVNPPEKPSEKPPVKPPAKNQDDAPRNGNLNQRNESNRKRGGKKR